MSVHLNPTNPAAASADVARSEPVAPRRKTPPAEMTDAELERLFHRLAKQWRRETGHISFITRRAQHPAHMRIVAMGMRVVPLILRELERDADNWLYAMHIITGEDPGPPTTYYEEARQSWLEWGKQKGVLGHVGR